MSGSGGMSQLIKGIIIGVVLIMAAIGAMSIFDIDKEEAAAQSDNTTFGMLQINAINPDNNQPLKATYTVFDQKNTKVAESKNTANASYRLPIGQYKVETTLDRVDEVTNQVIPVVTKSRYIIVRKNTTVKQTFELEPPATTGVLQVSAKKSASIVVITETLEVLKSKQANLFKPFLR